MAAVHPDLGVLRREFQELALGQPLQAARPFDRGHRLLDHGVGQREAGRLDGADRRCGIGDLVSPGKARKRQIRKAEFVLVDQPAELLVGGEILPVDRARAGKPVSRLDKHVQRPFVFLLADHDRAAALHDAGLFSRDQFDAIAEIGLVVERNRHDHRDRRLLDDIGGIEPAAEPDLENHGIGRLFGKEHEGHRRQDLEDGDLLSGIGRRHPPQGIGEHLVGDDPGGPCPRSDAIALVPVNQMRRGVDVDGEPRGLQERAAKSRRRTLAVGAGDMDDGRQLAVRVAEHFEQPADPVERKIKALRMKGHELFDFLFGRADGGGIGGAHPAAPAHNSASLRRSPPSPEDRKRPSDRSPPAPWSGC